MNEISVSAIPGQDVIIKSIIDSVNLGYKFNGFSHAEAIAHWESLNQTTNASTLG